MYRKDFHTNLLIENMFTRLQLQDMSQSSAARALCLMTSRCKGPWDTSVYTDDVWILKQHMAKSMWSVCHRFIKAAGDLFQKQFV